MSCILMLLFMMIILNQGKFNLSRFLVQSLKSPLSEVVARPTVVETCMTPALEPKNPVSSAIRTAMINTALA